MASLLSALLRFSALCACALCCVGPAAARSPTDHIEVVHYISSCHLDVGFADSEANIVNRYFDRFFLNAVSVAQQLRQKGGDAQLAFMTHSYLVSLFLDCPQGMGIHCPSAATRQVIVDALKRGDLWIHAFPFNGEAEVMDPAMFLEGVKLSQSLADSLGIPRPIVMSQRDVPGITRSVIPLLRNAGVTAFSLGTNSASLPPAVPRTFVWRDPVSGDSVLTLVHPFGYGGINVTDCTVLPQLSHAMCPAWRGDNLGPPSVDEVEKNFAQLHQEFPNAKIVASTLDAFVKELDTVRDSLPVVETEIGDTWIYGVPSDPFKVAANRVMMRARSACLASGRCSSSDPRLANFTRLALKNAEHTWGKDVKTFLHDTATWSNEEFHAVVSTAPNFVDIVNSWLEQRRWGIDIPLEALGSAHPLAQDIVQALKDLQPPPAWQPSTAGFQDITGHKDIIDCGSLRLSFDPSTGALTYLEDTTRHTVWATSQQPWGSLLYGVYNSSDYDAFFDQYAQMDENGAVPWYFPLDFGKPGLNMSGADPKSQRVTASLQRLWYRPPSSVKGGLSSHQFMQQLNPPPALEEKGSSNHQFIQQFAFPSSFVAKYGAPARVWVSLEVDPDQPQLLVSMLLQNKTATRIPESMWWRVVHNASSLKNPLMDKLGEPVSPLHVQTNGSQHLHGVLGGVSFTSSSGSSRVDIESQDAAVVCWGEPTPFPTPRSAPDLSSGVSFNLFNNIWGTNYVMWYPFIESDQNLVFRFSLTWKSS